MSIGAEDSRTVGSDTVVVIPVGPTCQRDFVTDTIDSVLHFAPRARVIVVDDSRRGLCAELRERYPLTVLEARAHGLHGSLYLNLSDGFKEALTQPFKVLVRLDTDALIAGSDFEGKALCCFSADQHLGSLGSFRIGYDCVGIRNRSWAKRQILIYLAVNSLLRPREALMVAGLVRRARRHGYKLGESILGGAAVYRYEAVAALDKAALLCRPELARTGLQEDHIFGLCLFAVGYRLGEFGNKYDDLPMGVDWKGLPAAPSELVELGKSIVHSTKSFDSMDEQMIRSEFRAARQREEGDALR
jgi:hypothetical protein